MGDSDESTAAPLVFRGLLTEADVADMQWCHNRVLVRPSIQRFVHISSIRVYDDRYCRQHRVVTEDAPHGERGFRHFGHYARAKVLAEAAVWRYASRLPITVIRPAWIYGPRDEVILPPLIRYLGDPLAFWPGTADPCADQE